MSQTCKHGAGLSCGYCWEERVEALLTRIAVALEGAVAEMALEDERAADPRGPEERVRAWWLDLALERSGYVVVPESAATATVGMKYDPETGDVSCQDPICPREHDERARHVERRKAVRVPLADPIDVFRKAVPATDQGAFDARAETGNQPNGTPRYDYALVGTVSAKKDGRRPRIDTDPGCYVIDGENLYVRRGHK